MKHLIPILCILILVSLSFQAHSQDVKSNEKIWATFNDISILPQLNEGQLVSSSDEFQLIIDSYNIKACVQILADSRKEDLLKVYEISCDCDQSQLIEVLEENIQSITGIEPGPKYEILYMPNDYNLIFAEDYALDLIDAQKAWDYTLGDTSVEIAISDSNFDLDHQELLGTTTYIHSPLTHPNIYHGTAVATLAAGNTDNDIGKSSIGANCSLQLYSMSYSHFLTATYSGAKVINVSWTSGCSYGMYFQSIIDEVYENGTIIVAAAGNGETCGGAENHVYPASLNHVISVSSIGPLDNHERSIDDPTTTHQHNDSVDICAPGYDVALTVIDGWYLTGNGTSFAAPIVSGTIGLMLSVNPCLTFEDIEFILDATAHNIDTINPLYAGKLGAGRMDAGKAVEMASEYQTFNIGMATAHGCLPNYGSALITPIVDEGTLPFTALWSNGDTTMVIEVLEPGDFSVIVFDSKGCVSKKEVTISVSEELFIDEDLINVHCYGDSTGYIDLSIAGGTTPYFYEWSNGSMLEDLEELSIGTYSIIVTDINDCISLDTFFINQPEELLLELDVTNNYDAFAASELDLSVYGGTTPYEYLWSNDEFTEDITGLEAGAYGVLVTDANGCSKYEEIEVFGPVLGLELTEEVAIQVYPNPSDDGNTRITWGTSEVSLIVVSNAIGETIFVHEVNTNQHELFVKNLSSGLYMVHVMNGLNHLAVKKLIIN
ncbi:MAG: hypothetical protein ACI8ZM_002396 [Crocinitomix sp.]|jgi:hypothetical protein